mgnify:CR=1 FL=1
MYKFHPGDHLVTNIDPLGLTEHHGLYVGHGNVIHLSKQGIIEEIDLQQFAGGHKIRVKKSTLFPHQAIELARNQLGHLRAEIDDQDRIGDSGIAREGLQWVRAHGGGLRSAPAPVQQVRAQRT